MTALTARTLVKVCGVCSPEDAELCVEAGADLVGINFFRGSPRYVDERAATMIVRAVAGRALTVGVFVNEPASAIVALKESVGLDRVQLHGDEPPEDVALLAPFAFKAISVGHTSVREDARRFAGELLLLDAQVSGARGGTGRTFDWSFAREVAEERDILLAGGLTPENVADAIRVVRARGVDVASGVERAPREKDPALVRAFVERARRAR